MGRLPPLFYWHILFYLFTSGEQRMFVVQALARLSGIVIANPEKKAKLLSKGVAISPLESNKMPPNDFTIEIEYH